MCPEACAGAREETRPRAVSRAMGPGGIPCIGSASGRDDDSSSVDPVMDG